MDNDDLFHENWHYKYDESYTFFGSMSECWGNVAAHWNYNTQKTYARDYERYILPYVDSKALKNCSREDFDFIMNNLAKAAEKRNLTYNDNVYRHIQHLINRVLEAADAAGICPNVLWGSEYTIKDNETEEELYKDELVTLRKSLTIREEIAISKEILTDPKQTGERMGLALMFCLGLRNNEACGADFGDIHAFDCDSNYYGLWIYKSTIQGSNTQRYGGKTSNVSRIVPIPVILLDILLKRREYLRTEVSKLQSENKISIKVPLDDYIDTLPIAGGGNTFDTRCKSADLTKAGTKLLRDINLEQEMLSLIDRDIRKPGRTEEGLIEKDPTAYLFRRNLGTHLYLLGLEDNEIQYIFAHEIEDENDERNYFRNEEKLYPIAQKMALRPIVNPISSCLEEYAYTSQTVHSDIHHLRIHLLADRSHHHQIIVHQREPFSKTELSLDGPEAPSVTGTCTQFPNSEPYSDTLSITTDYHRLYQRQLNKRNTKEENSGAGGCSGAP